MWRQAKEYADKKVGDKRSSYSVNHCDLKYGFFDGAMFILERIPHEIRQDINWRGLDDSSRGGASGDAACEKGSEPNKG